MVGDKGDDLLFAANAGLAFRALVLSGKGAATARELGITLPGKGFFQVIAEPESPAYPHLVLSSFRQLERGLELLTHGRMSFCGA
jgi:D-glycero-D-manno-heptose 1,7-bisphosphate phosphatase